MFLQRECQVISSVSRSDSFKILHNSRIFSVNLVPLSSGFSSTKKPLASHLIRATSLGEAFLNDTRPELTFGLTQGVDAPQAPKEPIGKHPQRPQQPQLQFISVRYISALSSRQAGSTCNGIKNWAWYPPWDIAWGWIPENCWETSIELGSWTGQVRSFFCQWSSKTIQNPLDHPASKAHNMWGCHGFYVHRLFPTMVDP